MHLRDTGSEDGKERQVYVIWREVGGEPALEIDDPLTYYVIRNVETTEAGDDGGENSGYENEVGINLAVEKTC